MNLFDIIGPVMIGPSSSHTAGAARIGRVARQLLGEPPVKAVVSFHGSFEKTYRGHGTDRAVVGGLLDMAVDDERLRRSLHIAKEQGLEVTFRAVHLRDAHPNTVVVEAVGESGRRVRVQAASIGGCSIWTGWKWVSRARKSPLSSAIPTRPAPLPWSRACFRRRASISPPCGCFATRWAARPAWPLSWTPGPSLPCWQRCERCPGSRT